MPCSDQELRSCPEAAASVGVGSEWRSSILGDGGFVSERSRECVGFGGRGTSQPSPASLKENNRLRLHTHTQYVTFSLPEHFITNYC